MRWWEHGDLNPDMRVSPRRAPVIRHGPPEGPPQTREGAFQGLPRGKVLDWSPLVCQVSLCSLLFRGARLLITLSRPAKGVPLGSRKVRSTGGRSSSRGTGCGARGGSLPRARSWREPVTFRASPCRAPPWTRSQETLCHRPGRGANPEPLPRSALPLPGSGRRFPRTLGPDLAVRGGPNRFHRRSSCSSEDSFNRDLATRMWGVGLMRKRTSVAGGSSDGTFAFGEPREGLPRG